MAKNMVVDVTEKNMIAQFKVGYIYFTSLKRHKIFQEKYEKT